MGSFDALRKLAKGSISTSDARRAINENTEPTLAELEQDEDILMECTDIGLGFVLQSEMFGEEDDRAIDECGSELRDYLVGQGVINESTISINNPRMNYVRLNKQAQINRLRKIIIIKLGRKNKRPAFKKYRIGIMLKKTNMEILEKEFGKRAESLAKKVWQNTAKKGKVKATIEDKKSKKK